VTPDDAFAGAVRRAQVSLPEQTAEQIRGLIVGGRLAPGSRLPTEPQLAGSMGVSRGTVRSALHQLCREGLLWQRQGKGTFVSQKPLLENRLDINAGITDLIRAKGCVPGCRDMRIATVAADEYVSQQLGVDQGADLVEIRRVRTANDKAVAASIDWFPAAMLERAPHGLEEETLKAELERHQSVYGLIRDVLFIAIDHGIARVLPIKGSASLLRELHLDLPTGTVILCLEQVDYDRNQQPVLFSREYHVPDFTVFSVYRR